MQNKKLKLFGAFIALVIAAFVIITLSIDGMVKSGIEENGSELFQTEVSVDNVDISLFNGSGTIDGFVVKNPEKFSDEPAIRIQEVSLQVDLGSLFSQTILVKNMRIISPQLYFEQRGFGVNLKTLNDNMDLASDGSSDKNLIIEHLVIEDGRVKVSTKIDRKRTAKASISEFELEGIGRDGSSTVKQSVQQVMKPLLEKAMAEAIKDGVTNQLESKVKDLFN